MNWYIAICSLVTGVVIGLLCAKWTDVKDVKDRLSEFLRYFIRNNDTYNRNMGRLFDINREILKAHLARTDYDYAMARIGALEPPLSNLEKEMAEENETRK